MTGTAAIVGDLLAECDSHGIRLALAGDGGLEIDSPQNALTPELLDRLKAHKAELLAILRTKNPFARNRNVKAERTSGPADASPGPTCRDSRHPAGAIPWACGATDSAPVGGRARLPVRFG